MTTKERQAAWYFANKKNIRIKQNEYRKKNHDKILARQRLRFIAKREEISAYQKAYQKEYREKQKAKQLQQKAEEVANYQAKVQQIKVKF